MSDFTLQRCFPARSEAVIDLDIRGEDRALATFAEILDRAKLDLDFARFGDSRIGAVEGTIGPGGAAPAGQHGASGQYCGRFPSPHGWKTKMARALATGQRQPRVRERAASALDDVDMRERCLHSFCELLGVV